MCLRCLAHGSATVINCGEECDIPVTKAARWVSPSDGLDPLLVSNSLLQVLESLVLQLVPRNSVLRPVSSAFPVPSRGRITHLGDVYTAILGRRYRPTTDHLAGRFEVSLVLSGANVRLSL
jgi:hypothetical protein